MSQLNESKNVYRKDTATLNAEKENELAIAEKGDSIIERSGTYLSEAKKHNHINIEEKKKQRAHIAQTVLSEIDKLIQSIEQDLSELKGYVRDAKKVAKEIAEEVDKAEKAFQEAEILNKAILSKDEDKLADALKLYSEFTQDEIKAMPYEAKLAYVKQEMSKRFCVIDETEKFLKAGLEEFNTLKKQHQKKEDELRPQIKELKALGREDEAKALEDKLDKSKNELNDCKSRIDKGIAKFSQFNNAADLLEGVSKFDQNNEYCDDFGGLIEQSIKKNTFKKGDIKNVFTDVSSLHNTQIENEKEVSENPQTPKETTYDNGGFNFGA